MQNLFHNVKKAIANVLVPGTNASSTSFCMSLPKQKLEKKFIPFSTLLKILTRVDSKQSTQGLETKNIFISINTQSAQYTIHRDFASITVHLQATHLCACMPSDSADMFESVWQTWQISTDFAEPTTRIFNVFFGIQGHGLIH